MEKNYINSADGLLYCGKCRTPKQCRITAFGNESIQYCICQCEQNRLAEEKARQCALTAGRAFYLCAECFCLDDHPRLDRCKGAGEALFYKAVGYCHYF